MSWKLGSLFDGSGGFPLAGLLCDIEPRWASEIEPYPIAVTRSRFPKMKHLGDISKINGAEIEPVDIITFGSPCQDLSVAGKRAGLKHEANGDEETTRSGLFMEAVRIIKEMKEATNGEYPRFALWENVPGAFSSNKGEDFRIVLEELIKIVEPTAAMPAVPPKGWPYADSYAGDGWSIAYRVFDAQYWGVPQRRRRIHLVLDLRGECAREVLFEREGLRGYFAQGGTAWESLAADAEGGIGADDRVGKCYGIVSKGNGEAWPIEEKHMALSCGGGQAGQGYPCAMVPCTLEPGIAAREGGHIYEDVCGTLRANMGDNQMAVAQLVLDDQGGQNISVRTDGKAPTLRAEMHGNVPMVMESIAFAQNQRDEVRNLNGVAGALAAEPGMKQQTFIAQPIAVATQQGGAEISETGICPTITAAAGMSGNNQPWICQKEQLLFENHSQDTRYRGPLDVSPIISATFGMGGNNQPFVVEKQEAVAYNGENITSPLNKTNPQPGDPCHTLGTDSRNYLVIPVHDQATRFCGKRGDKSDGKGNGLGVGEPGDPMNTLTSGDRHAVAYAMQGFGDYKESDVASGLKARDYKDATDLVTEAPIAIDRAFFNQGQNALYDPQLYEDGTNPTLVARGPNAVAVRYIVRRLTPIECARLQGFADLWGEIEEKEDFTEEEYRFWLDVRNTHAEINGKAVKDYTKKQMLTWYNKLHTDSAEYKMWGNGIALPPALYCMQGIVDVLKREH